MARWYRTVAEDSKNKLHLGSTSLLSEAAGEASQERGTSETQPIFTILYTSKEPRIKA